MLPALGDHCLPRPKPITLFPIESLRAFIGVALALTHGVYFPSCYDIHSLGPKHDITARGVIFISFVDVDYSVGLAFPERRPGQLTSIAASSVANCFYVPQAPRRCYEEEPPTRCPFRNHPQYSSISMSCLDERFADRGVGRSTTRGRFPYIYCSHIPKTSVIRLVHPYRQLRTPHPSEACLYPTLRPLRYNYRPVVLFPIQVQ